MMAALPVTLLDSLASAPFGTSELDRMIWEWLIPPQFVHPDDTPSRFTASLDAAMSLAPVGSSVRMAENSQYGCSAAFGGRSLSKAKTLPLAVCIAAILEVCATVKDSPAFPEAVSDAPRSESSAA